MFILARSLRVFLSVSKARTLSRNTRISPSSLSLRSLAFCSSTISAKHLGLEPEHNFLHWKVRRMNLEY